VCLCLQVVALQKSPEYARVYQLLNIFAAGRVSDFTAFVGTGDNKAWMEALGVNVEGSERTVRLLTLASLASTSNHISYSTVAEALQVSAGCPPFPAVRTPCARGAEAASDDKHSSFQRRP